MPEPVFAGPYEKAIHLFVPYFRTDECLSVIRECLEQGWTGLGNKTLEIEAAWQEYSGLPHAHFLNSATAGLHLAMRILKPENGWQTGDEIIAVFSFHSVKNIPTSDSGMVCFREERHDRLARKLSWLGIDKDTYTRSQETSGAYRWKYHVEYVGFKYHGNSLTASLALVGLKYLDEDNDYRCQLAALYDELLGGHEDISIVRSAAGCTSSRHLYQVMVPHRDQVILSLNQALIYPGVHYADNTNYPMYAYARGTSPNAMRASDRVISLPLHLRLTEADVLRVATTLKSVLGTFSQSKPAFIATS